MNGNQARSKEIASTLSSKGFGYEMQECVA